MNCSRPFIRHGVTTRRDTLLLVGTHGCPISQYDGSIFIHVSEHLAVQSDSGAARYRR